MLILTIPLDLRRSLWSEVRGRSGQLLRELLAPLNAHNPIPWSAKNSLWAAITSPSIGLFVRRMSQPHSQPSIPVLTT